MRPDDGRVVSNFIVQALQNKNITIYGDGSQTRSFCYVDDLIEGFLRFSNAGKKCTGPINLGNPTEIPVRQLAEVIREMTNSRSRIVHLPRVTDDPKQRRPDISRAQAKLGWQPRVALGIGLGKTIEYFEARLSGGKGSGGRMRCLPTSSSRVVPASSAATSARRWPARGSRRSHMTISRPAIRMPFAGVR